MSPATLGVVFGILSGTMVFLALEELLPAAKRYAQGRETAYGMVAGMGVVALSLVLLR
jgi:ZIP family zinc transporter